MKYYRCLFGWRVYGHYYRGRPPLFLVDPPLDGRFFFLCSAAAAVAKEDDAAAVVLVVREPLSTDPAGDEVVLLAGLRRTLVGAPPGEVRCCCCFLFSSRILSSEASCAGVRGCDESLRGLGDDNEDVVGVPVLVGVVRTTPPPFESSNVFWACSCPLTKVEYGPVGLRRSSSWFPSSTTLPS